MSQKMNTLLAKVEHGTSRFREMGNHFGKKCISMDGKIYTLVGMSETFEDYYYILQKEDGAKSCHSCVGRVEFI